MEPKKVLPEKIKRHLESHLALYQTDPVRAHLWDSSVIGVPGPVRTLMLTTRGRKSGEPRPVTLQYFTPARNYVVVGSKGGVADDPIWFLNLQADPICEVQVAGEHASVRARVADGEERETLWKAVSDEQPAYQRYQLTTERKIPVVVLERVELEKDFK